MAQIFLTTTGANTWIVPSDWNSASNSIQIIGAGGSGGTSGATGSGGGAGGSYGKISNLSLTPNQSISYTIGTGGAHCAAGTTLSGNSGGDTFFNGATVGASSISVTGSTGGVSAGAGGTAGTPTAPSGTTFLGGAGAAHAAGAAGGGGGAAGLNGAGIAGSTTGAGGNGDNNSGGTGGTQFSPPNEPGGNGTEYDASHGSGGGGGGGNGVGTSGGTGGLYGGGGVGGSTGNASSAGAQGLIVITYTSIFSNPRYWVGGTGNWDASTTTNWSLTSGGASGASVPNSTKDAVFDFNSGAGTVTLTASPSIGTFNSVFSTIGFSMGSQIITIGGAGNVWNIMGALVLMPGTSTIKITNASSGAKTFAGNGLTYNNLWITGVGTGQYTISGNNTFNDFKVDTPPHTVNFTANSITTIQTFTVNGTAGNLMTLQSTVSGTAWYLVKSAVGTISCDYLSLQDSHAL